MMSHRKPSGQRPTTWVAESTCTPFLTTSPTAPSESAEFSQVSYYRVHPTEATGCWKCRGAEMLITHSSAQNSRCQGERRGPSAEFASHKEISQLGKSPIWLLGNAELKGLSLLGELQLSSSFSSHSLQLGAEAQGRDFKTSQYLLYKKNNQSFA